MQGAETIPLVISEIAGLWNGYMIDSSAICQFRHFLNHVEDGQTREVLQYALGLSERHVREIEEIFNRENLTVPQAFSEGDVDVNVPRLFTDSYYLFYLNHMAGFGVESYALILRYTARPDIRNYFSRCIVEATDLYNKVAEIQLSKGLFLRAPRVEVSKKHSFVKDTGFFKGLLTDPRPLIAREATNLFTEIIIDIMIRATALGFGQVSRSQQVRDYMFRGRDLATNHLEGFSSKLNKEDIPAPSVSDSFVTDSAVSPFSDKLMMFQMLELLTFGLVVDGAAVASSLRNDLTVLHLRYGSTLAKYARDGMDIMIENGWMEQPPQVVSHESLVMV